MTRIACAIYTRKSSDEGLEQEFNSLDAQREACEAFIRSQKHAGWVAVQDLYDDGGLSGGTLERPALQRLLADIKAGRVEIVVVYKVDRLTRSLADFAKIVDVLDARGASFVSVTQQFNTTTSMGRLTLNMLLSFAQFEREIAGERIRDKIAASKAKGMWMGGTVPLGYDVKDRRLIVNPAEAETVRLIFQRYAELGSVALLQAELDRFGCRSKRREGARGRLAGGRPFSRGVLYLILRNRLYRGEVAHKGNVYPGQHEAIVGADLWQIVQDKLATNRRARSLGLGAETPSLLSGLIFDGDGKRMTPTHANKRGRRYRYYISASLLDCGASGANALRVPRRRSGSSGARSFAPADGVAPGHRRRTRPQQCHNFLIRNGLRCHAAPPDEKHVATACAQLRLVAYRVHALTKYFHSYSFEPFGAAPVEVICEPHRSRMATIPPGYNSGRASIFREPHTLHFKRLPIEGTGVSPGNGRLSGSRSRSRPHSVQYTHNSLPPCAKSLSVTGEVMSFCGSVGFSSPRRRVAARSESGLPPSGGRVRARYRCNPTRRPCAGCTRRAVACRGLPCQRRSVG
jgi:DNA invertase Pin-like site-specific DNA recombinase